MKHISQINPHEDLGYKSPHQKGTCVSPEKEEFIDSVWISLQNMGLISHNEHVDSPKFQTWARAMQELTDDELKKGLKGAEDHTGWFSLGDFKKYCKVQGLSPDGKNSEAYRIFEPTRLLPDKAARERSIVARDKFLKDLYGA